MLELSQSRLTDKLRTDKTYGAGSDNVEVIVRNRLDDPDKQYKSVLGMGPWTHPDPNYNYISGRWPGDAQLLSDQVVDMVRSIKST